MKLLLIEIYKVFIRRRSYIAFAAVFLVIVVLLLALNYEGEEMLGFITKSLQDSFSFQGSLINGNLFAHVVLRSLWVHIPMLLVLVTGDLVAGECQSGTIRLILSRPISRFLFITNKFVAGFIYTILLVLFLALASLGLGHLFFGNGDLLVIGSSLNIFNADDVLWRFALAFSFGTLSMLTVVSMALLMSVIMDNSVSAILSSLAIVIVLTFISSFNLGVLNVVQPFLFTTYMGSWNSFFEYNIDFVQIATEASVLFVHIIGFYILALFVFSRKDILS